MRFDIQHENGKICATRVDYDKPWGLDLVRSLSHSEWRLLREVFPKCCMRAVLQSQLYVRSYWVAPNVSEAVLFLFVFDRSVGLSVSVEPLNALLVSTNQVWNILTKFGKKLHVLMLLSICTRQTLARVSDMEPNTVAAGLKMLSCQNCAISCILEFLIMVCR